MMGLGDGEVEGVYRGHMADPAPDPGLFDLEDLEAKRQAIAEARALPESSDLRWADVKRWLESWGKPDELPPPPWK
jgi:hypothetical protein